MAKEKGLFKLKKPLDDGVIYKPGSCKPEKAKPAAPIETIATEPAFRRAIAKAAEIEWAGAVASLMLLASHETIGCTIGNNISLAN